MAEDAPEDGKLVALHRERANLLRQCKRTQRRWIKALPEYYFQKYLCADKLKISHACVHAWERNPLMKRLLEITAEIAECEQSLDEQMMFANLRGIIADPLAKHKDRIEAIALLAKIKGIGKGDRLEVTGTTAAVSIETDDPMEASRLYMELVKRGS